MCSSDLPRLRARAANSHKGSFGTVGIVGGAAGMAGAAILAARGALFAGAGKVYVEASVDEDGDGRPGPQDPQGKADRFPVTVGDEGVDGLEIRLIKREPPPGSGRE